MWISHPIRDRISSNTDVARCERRSEGDLRVTGDEASEADHTEHDVVAVVDGEQVDRLGSRAGLPHQLQWVAGELVDIDADDVRAHRPPGRTVR
ncbi:MAG: hypothetical protein ABI112_16635 [Terracoccus sp.]